MTRKPSGLPPQVDAAWDYPLFDAIMGRRARRFGLGMEMSNGPFCYKSDKDPVPLNELETAMLVAAVGLLSLTFFIDTPIYRYFWLGTFVSMLSATVMILAVTKAVIWPATIVLRRH